MLVFLHGVAMDGSVWDPVVADLQRDHRCVVPTLSAGRAPAADAPGRGRVAARIRPHGCRADRGPRPGGCDADPNDHAAALALAGDDPRRVVGLVISSCEAFENYPPGLPGKNLRLAALVPGGLFLAAQAMRLPAVRRSPVGLGWMAKRPLPDELTGRWFTPLRTDPRVRRDLARYARRARRHHMIEVCDRLRAFDRPALVIWTPEDRVQRPEHGRRLAALLPHAQLVEIPDSYSLIMRDQPEAFASAVREFVLSLPT